MIKKELDYFNSRLHEYSRKLTSSDEIIARYIISNPEKVITMKISELTEKLYISKASLIRFCQKLKYDGFIDLKNQLRIEMIEENDSLIESKQKNSLTDSIIDHKKILDRFLRFVKEEELIEMVNHIKKFDEVFVFGSGGFSILAKEFALVFRKKGFKVEYIASDFEMELMTKQFSSKSMVVVLSHKCSENNLMHIFKLLNKKDVFSYLITSYGNANIKNLSSSSLILPNLVHLKMSKTISPSFILIILIDLLKLVL